MFDVDDKVYIKEMCGLKRIRGCEGIIKKRTATKNAFMVTFPEERKAIVYSGEMELVSNFRKEVSKNYVV